MNQKRQIKNYLIIGLYLVFLLAGLVSIQRYNAKRPDINNESSTPNTQLDNTNTSLHAEITIENTEQKKKIQEKPLDAEKNVSGKITQEVTKNQDGSEKVVFSSGKANAQDVDKINNLTNQVNGPLDIIYDDETGKYPLLGQVLKEYLNSKLKWSNEIGSLKEIIVKEIDTRETGWCGLYSGSYEMSAAGNVTKVNSSITINVFKDCYHSEESLFNDYMKLILSHEYGHHYTLYHKWVDWNILADGRFPDVYYSLRKLDKNVVAVDYSKGWANCESEIIAEDYSYFYSGYDVNRMSSSFGYPSTSVKNWLANIQDVKSNVVADLPPSVTILSPSENQTIAGVTDFSVNAVDDFGIQKVSFFINNKLVLDLTKAPYQGSIDTTDLPEGENIFRAMATDGSNSAEAAVKFIVKNNLNIADTEPPTVKFLSPETPDYKWSGDDKLQLETLAHDNIKIARIELYINNYKAYPAGEIPENTNFDHMRFEWLPESANDGKYEIKAVVFDTAGNKGESTIFVTRLRTDPSINLNSNQN